MKDILAGGNMKKIVKATHIREILRRWRTKYDYLSPGKTGVG